jgi:hypothetical protein
VWCVLGKKCITQQPTGVLGRKTYGPVAVEKKNPGQMSLDLQDERTRQKTQMSAKSEKTYIKLRVYHNTEIYGSYYILDNPQTWITVLSSRPRGVVDSDDLTMISQARA